jgi:hypothetical protein
MSLATQQVVLVLLLLALRAYGTAAAIRLMSLAAAALLTGLRVLPRA